MLVKKELDSSGTTRTYRVIGQIFFASADKFTDSFDFREAVARVVIDLSGAHFLGHQRSISS